MTNKIFLKYKKKYILTFLYIHSQKWWRRLATDSWNWRNIRTCENPMHGKWKSRMLAYFIMASIRENCIFYIVGKSSSITWDMDHSCRDIFRFSPGIYNFASIYTVWASREQKTISQMDLFLSEGSSGGLCNWKFVASRKNLWKHESTYWAKSPVIARGF